MKRTEQVHVGIVPVTPENRDALLDMTLQFWADDAVACPTCSEPWTVERIKTVGAKVKSVDPRILICEPCWTDADTVEAQKRAEATK